MEQHVLVEVGRRCQTVAPIFPALDRDSHTPSLEANHFNFGTPNTHTHTQCHQPPPLVHQYYNESQPKYHPSMQPEAGIVYEYAPDPQHVLPPPSNSAHMDISRPVFGKTRIPSAACRLWRNLETTRRRWTKDEPAICPSTPATATATAGPAAAAASSEGHSRPRPADPDPESHRHRRTLPIPRYFI